MDEVLQFIEDASDEDKTILKAALKQKTVYPNITDLCAEDIKALCDALPRTDAVYKGFRYDMTAMTYVRHVIEIANVITHNFQVHHNNRAYKSWMHNYAVPPTKQEQYKTIFHTLTTTILSLMTATYNP